MKTKVSILMLIMLILQGIFEISYAEFKTIGIYDIEYMPEYEKYVTYKDFVGGKKPKFSYGLGQFCAYVSSEAYRNPKELYDAGYVDTYTENFAPTLKFNDFEDITLVSYYDSERIYPETFVKKFGGLSKFLSRATKSNLGWEDPDIKSLAKASMQAVVAWKWIEVRGERRRVIVIGFRGTEVNKNSDSIHEDWLLNALSNQYEYDSKKPDIKVHSGYYAAMKAFEEREPYIKIGDKTLRDVIEEAKTNKDVFVLTGHSAGGAIANLYGAKLIDPSERKIENHRVTVYSYGAPPLGNEKFKEYFFTDKKNPRAYLTSHRVVERFDLIPYANNGAKLWAYIKGGIGEFFQAGEEEKFSNGYAYIKENEKKLSFQDKFDYIYREIKYNKLKHHDMKWYKEIVAKEAMNHNRGDISKPIIMLEKRESTIYIYTIVSSKIYISWGSNEVNTNNQDVFEGAIEIPRKRGRLNIVAVDKRGNTAIDRIQIN